MDKSLFERMRGSGGTAPPRQPFTQIAWSFIGAFLAISAIALLGEYSAGALAGSLFLVGSFGASAVLVYGIPASDYAQPRNLVGGHLLSAFTGVCVVQLLPFALMFQAALAVALAIVVMQVTRTLHPPGGATALIAVIGGPAVHELGFLYILSPIGLGALLMLLVALIVNNQSDDPARHYPRYWY